MNDLSSSCFEEDPDKEIPMFDGSLCGHPLETDVITAIRTVYDPEIPVNIYDLGLIYTIHIDDNDNLDVKMTLTAPGCPVAGEMPEMVRTALSMMPAFKDKTIDVSIIWEPAWTKARMSEIAQLELGMF
jgi:FeS assembly SUF system protein